MQEKELKKKRQSSPALKLRIRLQIDFKLLSLHTGASDKTNVDSFIQIDRYYLRIYRLKYLATYRLQACSSI